MNLGAEHLEDELPDHEPLYTSAEARAEAERCLYCVDAPCIAACPTEIDIPTFIRKLATGNVDGSAKTILAQNILGRSCASVCPVDVLCVGACVYNGWERPPIAIGRLQRYATETATAAHRTSGTPLLRRRIDVTVRSRKVACIGAGPASLAFAATLVLEGHNAIVFERRPFGGGLNTSGIAPYKLHVRDALSEIAWIEKLGVEVVTGVAVGDATGPFQISGVGLLETYDAVFVGVGLGNDTRLGIPFEDGPDVHGATAWIARMKLELSRDARASIRERRIVVIGGGNTALDAARECALLGAKDVTVVYRRSAEAMSAYAHEVNAARMEGVRFVTHAQPICVVRNEDQSVRALRVATTDANGKPVPNAEYEMACDTIIVAIGQSKIASVAHCFPGVKVDARGLVVCDAHTGETGHPKVFAGGDCVNGGKEVVNAVAEGRNAARALLARWGKP